jgi:intracellular sulfur oxidation DsrE/DsrF family protein
MGKTLKLLIHVAQAETWNVAIGNAVNFLKAVEKGDTPEIRMIANGNAVTVCAHCPPELLENLTMLAKHGVKVYLCENSLKKHGIPVSSLPSILGTVPAGIRALVDLQEEGWRYVRP